MTWRRSGAALLAALLAVICLLPSAAAAAEKPRPLARAWTLIDARSGAVLASHAAAERLPIASTTKLMTAYVALQELPLKRMVGPGPSPASAGAVGGCADQVERANAHVCARAVTVHA